MPFKPGHQKVGGRAKGTPNKSTQDLMAKCVAMKVEPFDVLLEYARSGTDDQRITAAKELCQYLYAKRKSVETTIAPEYSELIQEAQSKSDEELVAILKPLVQPD